MKYPKRVTVIELENAPFRCAKDAVVWAKQHGVVGLMSDEIHPDRMKRDGRRSPANGVNPDVTVLRLYGCVAFGDIPLRAKVTLKQYVDPNEKAKAYSYEISNIEVLKGNAGVEPLPSDRTSMDVSILLNGVCDVNGEPLLK